MKDIGPKLIDLFRQGFCTPQVARIARKINEPSTTIHYNIKKLEKEGAIKAYKAVFDYKKIEQGYCAYILANIRQELYGDPEEVAERIAKDPRVESVDICTGDYELLIKLRTKDIDEYYAYIKAAIKQFGFLKTSSITSLKQTKTEFIEL